MSVEVAAHRLARDLVVDEERDVVRWRDERGAARETGLHDYAALYAVTGLYDAAYAVVLQGGSPRLLAEVLGEVVPEPERARLRVLDVGAGSGAVGAALAAVGFRRISGTDLEPASEVALRRDRPDVYVRARTTDLARLTPDDVRWIGGVAPEVVTVAGAVGFGHLPVEAFAALTRLLPPGALLALAVAPDLATEAALAGHAALLLGPAWTQVARREGVHRQSATGPLGVAALVLRRTGVGP